MVWISTKQSLENREVSFLAIVEIFLAIGIYWGVAIYFDAYLHIWMSVLLAPFLLLRSTKSINKGLTLLDNGVHAHREYSSFFRFTLETVIVLNVFLITYILFEQYINPDDIVFVLFFLIFCSGIGFGIGRALFGTMDIKRISILSVLCVLSTITYLGGINVLLLILSFLLISWIVVILLPSMSEIFIVIIVDIFFGIGASLGFLFVIFIYKLIAVISNFSDGYKDIIQNWRYSNFVIDLKYPPELMFGIEAYNGLNEFKLSESFSQIEKDDEDIFNKIIVKSFSVSVIYLILYPFAFFYRFSIKATFWFYIPLLILVQTPRSLRDNTTIKNFLSNLHRYAYARFLFILAIIALISFFVLHLNPHYLKEISNPFAIYISIIYFDLSSIEMWKLLQIAIAFLTVVLYFWSDYIWKTEENRNMNFMYNKQIRYIFLLNNIRNVFALFYFLFLFIYISYEFKIWEYKYIPNFVVSFLENAMQVIQYVF